MRATVCQSWCARGNSTEPSSDRAFPAPEELTETFESSANATGHWNSVRSFVDCKKMNRGKTQVAIITNNFPWQHAAGLIQRLYDCEFREVFFLLGTPNSSAAFGIVIFCGAFNSPALREDGYISDTDSECLTGSHSITHSQRFFRARRHASTTSTSTRRPCI